VRAGLVSAGAVIAVSRAMARSVLRHYGVARAVTIPNARDSQEYRPAAKQPFILTSGRAWDPAKNIMALDAASESLSWPVILAGEIRHPAGGAACARHLQTLGRLSARDLQVRFARAAIYTLPALYEPFGLSVLEAALSGCALVLGDIASLRENWQGAALFVSPRDPRELTAALRELSANRPQREELGRRARLRGLQFSPGRMARSYLAEYQRVRARRTATCAS
jgi:glycosyltransferase involved in cell wall biosynthesis